MVYLFDVPAYFILLRETLEVTIILAVLLGFIDKYVVDDAKLKKNLKKQIWIGTTVGLGISILIGIVFIVIFYVLKKNVWEDSEPAWEGAFSLVASVVITIMSLSMVRVQQWKAKWEGKLKSATEQYLKKHEKGNKWALILLPFTVVCREAVESIVFIAGIGFENPATGLPIPIITGIISGFIIGYLIYKGSHKVSLKVFFGITTVLLLFIAAGLFATSAYELQEATGTEEHILWELECCDPEKNGFWGVMKAIFGWRNEATVASTVAYFVYWVFVGIAVSVLLYIERRKAKLQGNNGNDEKDENVKDENVKDENVKDENEKDEKIDKIDEEPAATAV